MKRAENSGQLAGWRVWTEGTGADLKSCIEIKRKDWEQPFYHEVFLDEYTQNNSMWKTKPRTMIKKVAIAQGFRLAFPVELGGIPYTADEMPTATATDSQTTTPIIETTTTSATTDSSSSSLEEIQTALSQLGLECEEKKGWIKIIGNTFNKTQTLKQLDFKFLADKKIWVKKVA